MGSNNKIADGLLASAHDSAVHDGLRLAVPRYLEAADALIAESRQEEASSVLAELLSAKEKRRGFFLGKREQSALGNQREAVAKRYAQLARGAAPTESSLDVLNQLALEFPDDFDIRVANAEALRQAGYLLDALDEYKYCISLHAEDFELDERLSELYGQLGRADEAVAHARQTIARYANAGDDAAVAGMAVRLLDVAPDAFEESLGAFASLSAESLAKHRSEFDAAVSAFVRSNMQDPGRRPALVALLAAAFEKMLARDRSDQSLWQALSGVDTQAEEQVRQRLDGKASALAPIAAPAPQPAPAPAPEPAPVPPQPKRPAAAGGLSAFAKRKALELFANSEYEASSVQLERVIKISPDVEALEMLLECYLALGRHSEAARIGVRLADAELAAGNRPGAITTLTALSKKIADPIVEQRRVELMGNK